MPAKAPTAQDVPTAAEPRLSGIAKVIFAAMQGFHSSSRQELLAAAKKAGYTEAELNAVLDYLVKTPVFVGEKPVAAAKPKAFDPHEAGRRLVEQFQTAEGGAWSGAELLERFGLTAAVLHKRRKEHRIVFWRDAQHNFHYPKWQFNAAGALLPGIQEVLEIFQSQDEWRVMRYFLDPRAQLSGLRPLDLLRQGDVEKVLGHARIHAEENTW